MNSVRPPLHPFKIAAALVTFLGARALQAQSQAQAKDKGFQVKVGKFPFSASGKAQAGGNSEGFVKVICNRPDFEVPPSLSSLVMADLVSEAGIEFHILELTHETMTPENILKQRKIFMDASGPVLAYCASGTRCSVIWALGEAMTGTNINYILEKTSAAGYNLHGLEPTLRQFSEHKG